jgi:hypothetical protein
MPFIFQLTLAQNIKFIYYESTSGEKIYARNIDGTQWVETSANGARAFFTETSRDYRGIQLTADTANKLDIIYDTNPNINGVRSAQNGGQLGYILHTSTNAFDTYCKDDKSCENISGGPSTITTNEVTVHNVKFLKFTSNNQKYTSRFKDGVWTEMKEGGSAVAIYQEGNRGPGGAIYLYNAAKTQTVRLYNIGDLSVRDPAGNKIGSITFESSTPDHGKCSIQLSCPISQCPKGCTENVDSFGCVSYMCKVSTCSSSQLVCTCAQGCDIKDVNGCSVAVCRPTNIRHVRYTYNGIEVFGSMDIDQSGTPTGTWTETWPTGTIKLTEQSRDMYSVYLKNGIGKVVIRYDTFQKSVYSDSNKIGSNLTFWT